MIQQYFKQAWRLLKENPVVTAISIAGTALAICMIMVMVMSQEVKNASFPPETNRDRMLYVKWMSSRSKENPDEGSSNSLVALALAKTCFKPMETPEAVSIVTMTTPLLASTPGASKAAGFDFLMTDETFWQVFNFSFIDGKPYTRADVDAGLRKAVITKKTAREVFGTEQAVGKTILLDYIDYTVAGVVRDVSTIASAAYAQIWIPYTSREWVPDYDEITGGYRTLILARSADDFPAIREEADRALLKYNDGLTDREAFMRGQPDTHFVYTLRKWANEEPDVKRTVIQYVVVIVLLLLTPAINLSSMTGSRMRKRLGELGVRRAFGATRNNLLSQTLWESLLQTFLGGALGLLFSYAAAYLLKGVIYMNSNTAYQLGDTSIDFGVLLNPAIFAYAFLFCVLLNILSAIVPAWRTSRKQIVDAISSK